jgi:DNA helicase II / ATP-dependent DNA helicase PcrA
VAHLRVLQNAKDELALNRILKLLPGIGDASADRLACNVAGGLMFGGLPDALLQCEVPAAARENVRKLSEALRQALACGGVGEKVDIVLAYYEPLLRMEHDDWPARLDDLNSLRQIAGGYAGNLEQFLSDMAIEPPSKSDRHGGAATPDDEKPLTLSTIHSAKGLEWHTVYLMGVQEGVLPSCRSSQDPEDVEEEHRLFYVAVTRAKARLVLTMAHRGNNGGIERLTRLSRFVEAPNVLSLLDRTSIVQNSVGHVHTANRDLRVPVLSKDELLQRLQKM